MSQSTTLCAVCWYAIDSRSETPQLELTETKSATQVFRPKPALVPAVSHTSGLPLKDHAHVGVTS